MEIVVAFMSIKSLHGIDNALFFTRIIINCHELLMITGLIWVCVASLSGRTTQPQIITSRCTVLFISHPFGVIYVQLKSEKWRPPIIIQTLLTPHEAKCRVGGGRYSYSASLKYATLLIDMRWRVFDTLGDGHCSPTLHAFGV